MKFWRNFAKILQMMLEFEEKYRQVAKFPKKSAKNLEKVGICESFHSAFHYFNTLTIHYALTNSKAWARMSQRAAKLPA